MRAYFALVVQKVDSAVHRTNYYPVVSAIGFQYAYLVDSAIWPVLGVQIVECGVKESKSRGKIRRVSGEWE